MTAIDKKINLIRDTIKKASHDKAIGVLSTSISSSDGSTDGIEKTYNFVKERVEFKEEPFGEDNYQYPTYSLKTGMGDCEDHSILLGSLLKAQGYNVGVKVAPRGDNKYHVWTVVKTGYGWLPLDTTIKAPSGSEIRARWSKIYPV